MKNRACKYIRGISSAYLRTKIRALFASKVIEKDQGGTRTPWKGFNDEKRAILTEAIFEIEDRREVSHGPYDKLVVQMRAVRNELYDDLGWNERRAMA